MLCIVAVPARAQSLEPSFDKLGEAIGQVIATLPEDDESLNAVQIDTSALREAASRITPADVPAYGRALDYDAELLETAARAPARERAAIVADVAQDLSIKRQAGAGMGSGTTFKGRIAVRVVTRRGTIAVPGYVIALNPVRWSGATPMYRLPRLSPADALVPPGRYEVLALLAGACVARDVVPIGLFGDDRVDIDLPVP
ncbi:hypothetical protein [Sphingomonas sp. R86520]|uniref:hypothetical protein n=1 Tax=Sphingomonas sp. R86520 TaxID=3093859 RepID=UPI0036D2BC2A